jgi:hypothetical protein
MWLDNVIIEGIQRLVLLRLKYSPALDTLEPVVDVWVDAFKSQPIKWDEELDAARIRQAFLKCSGMLDEFPAPRTVLQYLPSRPELLKLPSLNPRAPMPSSIKAAFNLAMQNSEKLSYEQRQEFKDREQENLNYLIRQMKH